MSALARSGCMLAALWCALGCSETLDVLSSAAHSPDASVLVDAGPELRPCETCRSFELCAVDRCVDTAGITVLSAGQGHTCRVRSGRIECWGDNALHQLGLNDDLDRLTPSMVGDLSEWLDVSAGDGHTCALRSPGALYCAGDNAVGQLGFGDRSPRAALTPLRVARDFRQIACGGDNCCALRASGALYCFGDNMHGTPGLGDAQGSPDIDVPTRLMSADTFASVSVGTAHACAIRSDGALFCWGRNIDGELGVSRGALQYREPMRVGRATDWRSVAAGEHHTCGVRGEGSLYCWGGNEFGELGIGRGLDDAIVFPEPVHVGVDDDWASVATGWFHTCALKHSGSLHCFGRSAEGQLGVSVIDRPDVPIPVAPERRFRTLALGRFHSCVVDSDRALYCFGGNTHGQLGTGDTQPRSEPTWVP